MSIKIGINGFGRIGRNVFRAIEKDETIEVVAINDLVDPKTIAHLLKYDSVFGRFDGVVEASADGIVVNGREIKITAERDPENIPWKGANVDIVLESTGIFATRELMAKHLKAGAKKVLLSVPPKDDIDAIIVKGVNDETLKPEDQLVSNASCTTNCLAPLAKVLHKEFGIKKGLMTTVHSYTNDQRMLDLPHSDLRRARAAALNMIPTTTGAAKAVGKVLPELAGKLHGMAIRVPTPDGSVVDLVAELGKTVSVEDINAAIKSYAEGSMKGVLKYTEDPIVSSDIIGDPSSSVFDALSTMVMDGTMVKVVSWYDNEWGYSNRCVDLFKLMAQGL
ncbi:type I glyceraldehyde-3-phosphate dehydrogenase [PVC group bacterium (ex Bugula neritina AB1)]|nr:type I glyceraldehyde-3-phosphate dehydrogenase [PVC group bacterium (ex Bugula neritina AB1)]